MVAQGEVWEGMLIEKQLKELTRRFNFQGKCVTYYLSPTNGFLLTARALKKSKLRHGPNKAAKVNTEKDWGITRRCP